jgi:EAL domain-containing protein (putative c-di-GMP-specific phosphodiesterase class I)
VELLCEGVENEDDLDWLQGHGVHRVQGWYFSAAGTTDRVETWLTRFGGASGPLPVQEIRALLS